MQAQEDSSTGGLKGGVCAEDTCDKRSLIIKVGSRKSQLALIQTHLVIDRIKEFQSNNQSIEHESEAARAYGDHDLEFEVVSMTTEGDRILDKPLPDIGTKSLFTRDLEVALMEGQLDFIVHSLKDLPTTLPDGCAIGAIMKRDNPNDSIVMKKSLCDVYKPLDLILGKCSDKTGRSIKIGTSSLRRIAMLRRYNPGVECIDIRGNLNTRLRKLDDEDGEYSAIILARAGLDRMNWSDRCSSILSPEEDARLDNWCYAVGQGAIAVECRKDDQRIKSLLETVNNLKTTYEAVAERSLLKELNGGCSVPLGVRSNWISDKADCLELKCVILSVDGKEILESKESVALCTGNDFPSDLESSTDDDAPLTDIVLSNLILAKPHVKQNLVRCSKLGLQLANKLKGFGALDLMKRSR